MKEMLGMMEDLFYRPAVTNEVYSSTSTRVVTTTRSTSSFVASDSQQAPNPDLLKASGEFRIFEILNAEHEKSPLWNRLSARGSIPAPDGLITISRD